MKKRWECWRLPILIGAFVLLTTAYSIILPLGEAPDEVSHFAYIQHLLFERNMPTAQGAVSGEAHQPPLYYLFGAWLTAWIPQAEYTPLANPDFAFDQVETPNLLLHTRREAFPYHGYALAWRWFRMFSVLMGAITVWATWRIAQEFLPHEPAIAFGAAAFVAFLPAFTTLSAVVNNDNLVIMLSSLSVLISVRLPRRALTMRELIGLGVLLGLAMLTKLSGLVVWFFAATLFAYRAMLTRQWRATLLPALICFGLATLIVAPWMIYNLMRFGDPLGWWLIMQATPVRETALTVDELIRVMGWGLWASFWGRFAGALHLRMADGVYLALGLISLSMLFGWVKYVRARQRAFDARAILAAFVIFWTLMLAAFARWTLAVLGTDQARQLFPGLPLFALVFMIGLSYISIRHKTIVLTVTCSGLIALNVTVLIFLAMTFAGSPKNLASLPRLDAPSASDFGGTLRVLDYRIESAQVAPGGTVVAQIQWQALRTSDENYWLLLRLGNATNPIVQKDGVPANGHSTTDWWSKDQVFTSQHTLTVPRDAAPGRYPLWLGLHMFGTWDWLTVRNQDMLLLGVIEITGKR